MKLKHAAADNSLHKRYMIHGILEVLDVDVDHGFIIRAKQNMLTKPLRAPNVRCYDHRKQLLISNGLLGLTRRPSSAEPLSLEVSTETQGAAASEVTSKSGAADMPG